MRVLTCYARVMRGPSTGVALGVGSVETLVRALAEEFPELDRERLRTAVERATARIASSDARHRGLPGRRHAPAARRGDRGGERARPDPARAQREPRGSARTPTARWSCGCRRSPSTRRAVDLDPLLRLARLTERWSELPLDAMNALIDINDDARGAPARRASPRPGSTSGAATTPPIATSACCLIEPSHVAARTRRSSCSIARRAEWPVLVDLLGRRAVHATDDKERAELLREIAQIHERELGDAAGALDAYREADRLEPDRPDVLEALARLTIAGRRAPRTRRSTCSSGRAARSSIRRRARACWCAPPSSRSSRTGTARRAVRVRAQGRSGSRRGGRRVRAAAPRSRPARRRDHAAARRRRAAGARRASLALARPMPAISASRSATPTGPSGSTSTRARPIRRTTRPAPRSSSCAGMPASSSSSRRSSTSSSGSPTIRTSCASTSCSAARSPPQLGDKTGARSALSRVLDLDPEDAGSRRELADMLFEASSWAKARPAIESLLVDEDLLAARRSRSSCTIGSRAARSELGDLAEAARSTPTSRSCSRPIIAPSLELRTELGSGDPLTRIQDQLALASIAPPDERAARFAAIGDRYSELGDRLRGARHVSRGARPQARRSPAAHEVPRARHRRRRLELLARRRPEARRYRAGSEGPRALPPPRRDDRARRARRSRARDRACSTRRSTTTRTRLRRADDLESLLGGGVDRDALVAFLLPPARAGPRRRGPRRRAAAPVGPARRAARSISGATKTRSSRSRSRSSSRPPRPTRKRAGCASPSSTPAPIRSTTLSRSRITRRCCAPITIASSRTRRCARCTAASASSTERARATTR